MGALSDDEILDIITTRLDHFRLPPVPEVSQEDEEELDPQEDHNDGFATQIQLMKSTRVREPFPKTLRENSISWRRSRMRVWKPRFPRYPS